MKLHPLRVHSLICFRPQCRCNAARGKSTLRTNLTDHSSFPPSTPCSLAALDSTKIPSLCQWVCSLFNILFPASWQRFVPLSRVPSSLPLSKQPWTTLHDTPRWWQTFYLRPVSAFLYTSFYFENTFASHPFLPAVQVLHGDSAHGRSVPSAHRSLLSCAQMKACHMQLALFFVFCFSETKVWYSLPLITVLS